MSTAFARCFPKNGRDSFRTTRTARGGPAWRPLCVLMQQMAAKPVPGSPGLVRPSYPLPSRGNMAGAHSDCIGLVILSSLPPVSSRASAGSPGTEKGKCFQLPANRCFPNVSSFGAQANKQTNNPPTPQQKTSGLLPSCRGRPGLPPLFLDHQWPPREQAGLFTPFQLTRR